MKKRNYILIIGLIYASAISAFTEKPLLHQDIEIIPDIIRASEVIGNQRIEPSTGIPRAIYSPNYQVNAADPETMARQYLRENSNLLQHRLDLDEFKHINSMETPGGYRVQFIQHKAGYPVYGASIKISLNHDNKVVFVMNGYQRIGSIANVNSLSQLTALEIAKTHIKFDGKPQFENLETVVYANDQLNPRIAHKVNIVPGRGMYGDWEILVDAQSAEIIRAEDKANYLDGVRETGSGWVFDPDPISNAMTFYGQPQFSDMGDADTDSLTAQLKTVELENIGFDGTDYLLSGPYASIIDVEAPFTGYHSQPSSDFHFTRSEDPFEAVNTYYHIHHSMKYLNEDLGFDVMPYQYEGGVHFDPRALNGDNNAYFSSSTGWVAFGAPASNVDSGEDHAVILHELGHAIHDWITNGGLSQVDGLSEGLGDYWAQSYTRSLGIFDPADTQYDYFGQWGLQPLGGPTLRVTDFPNHYPEGLGGEVHYDGQLWSSSLMSIYDQIGRTATDTDCWEGISMTDYNSNQVDAAFAFIQADQDLYAGANLSSILPVFIARGYLPGPIIAMFESDVTGGPGPLTVNFEDRSFVFPGPITNWDWDFNNDGIIDSQDQNPTHIFTEPGLYSVSLLVSDGENSHSITEIDYISVNGGILVYEGEPDGTDYSGTYINSLLNGMGIETSYSNRLWSSLIGYDAIFVSLGNIGEQGNTGTFLDDAMGASIMNYASAGGNVYIEGGSTMGGLAMFGYPEYETFWELFGIENANIVFDSHAISGLLGQSATITEGISFYASLQISNWYPDIIMPNETGLIAFVENELGNVAVQNQGAFGQKTFYCSYSLAGLVDGDLQNTRQQYLMKILEFFEVPLLVPAFATSVSSGHAPLTVEFTDASTANPAAVSWQWDFNNDGVIDSELQSPLWIYEEPGDYSVSLTVMNDETTQSIVLEDVIHVFNGESALYFEGNDNYVVLSASETLNMIDGFTVEDWINPTGWGDMNDGDGRIIDKNYFRLFLNKSGSSQFADSSLVLIIKHQDGTLSKFNTPANYISLNGWQYVAATYNAMESEAHIYINGIDRTSVIAAASGVIKDHSEYELIIGNSRSHNRAFDGRLDELRFWDIVLSAEEIASRMEIYLEGNEEGLVGYWQMNEATGSAIEDLSGNGNHGLIYNSSWAQGTDFVVPVAYDGDVVEPITHLLLSNYPNPFNPSTTIQYALPSSSGVEIDVYNIQGKLINSVSLENQTAGWHQLVWNAVNQSGFSQSAGIYFCRIQTESEVQNIKMLLLK